MMIAYFIVFVKTRRRDADKKQRGESVLLLDGVDSFNVGESSVNSDEARPIDCTYVDWKRDGCQGRRSLWDRGDISSKYL